MRVAVVGSYGVGMTMRLPRVPVAGETLTGGTFSAGPGGKGSNQAIAAARLGARVTFLTAIGDDSLGLDARDLWAVEGVDAGATVTIADAATMVGMILVEPSGENRIVIAAGALDELTPAHVESFSPQLAAADIVIVSLEIPVETACAALRIARQSGTRTLLNPAPAHPLPDEAWGDIDVITPNRTEAAILLGHRAGSNEPASTLAAELHARGAGTVVITLGEDGALIHDSSGTRTVPAATPRAIVDTTGAGDTFTAALAVELAAGRSVDDAAEFAARAGAHAVSIAEVIPALPRRSDLSPAANPTPDPACPPS